MEIDHIISSPEGIKYIGESEGKKNKVINIDKLRQLFDNISSSYAEENEIIDGIIFGNAFTDTIPFERKECFSIKAIDFAKKHSFRLINTIELFYVANYVRETGDVNFASKCRNAIETQVGEIIKLTC